MHGSHVVLATESRHAYEEIKADTIAHYTPANEEELEIVTGLVDARWRLHRLITMETAALDDAIAKQTASTEATRAALAFSSLADRSRGLTLLHRHEGRMRRAIERALTRLDNLRAKQEKRKNEPDFASPAPHRDALFATEEV
jgi:hypothetical protein